MNKIADEIPIDETPYDEKASKRQLKKLRKLDRKEKFRKLKDSITGSKTTPSSITPEDIQFYNNEIERLTKELAEKDNIIEQDRKIISAQEAEIRRLKEFSDNEQRIERISFEDLQRLEDEANAKDRIIQAQVEEIRRLKRESQAQPQLPITELPREVEEQPEISEREPRTTGQVSNESGVGGIPGVQSKAVGESIEGTTYQGKDTIPLDSKANLEWNRDLNQYEFKGDNQGLKFTFFAAEMSYPAEGYNVPHALYSQTIFQRQVWYERPIKGKNNEDTLALLGFAHGGRVPMQSIIDLFNDWAGIFRFTEAKRTVYDAPPKADFRAAYKNWRYLYEQGTFYKAEDGKLYSIVYFRDEKSKGNPPQYRTAGRDRPKTGVSKGDQIPVKKEEAFRWIKNRVLR